MNKKKDKNNIQRLVVCSDLRKDLILTLYESQKSLGNIRDILKISATTAIHALRELEKGNLTFQEKNKNYCLTNIGKILAIKLLEFSDTTEVLMKHEIFWNEHDLSGIPKDLMEKIGWLKNSNIGVINELELIKTHDIYINSVQNAKWIKGASPIFSSDYVKVYKAFAEKNIPIQLLLSIAVFNKLTDVMGSDNLKNLIKKHNVEIFISNEDLKVAFTVTDAFLSFGLFSNNGIYDITYDLVSTDDMAIRWGCELYEYYCRKAKKCHIR